MVRANPISKNKILNFTGSSLLDLIFLSVVIRCGALFLHRKKWKLPREDAKLHCPAGLHSHRERTGIADPASENEKNDYEAN